MSILKKATEVLVQLTPASQPDPLKDSRRVIGQSVARRDGPKKVTGRAKFSAEIAVPRLTYATLVQSTIAKGMIASIDTKAAEASSGVVLVMTHLNAPKFGRGIQFSQEYPGASMSNLPVMQDASIHWNGEPVAIVIAESQDEADAAAALVRVSYAAQAATTDFDASLEKAFMPKTVLGEPPEVKVGGDAEAALAAAAVKVDNAFDTPRYYNSAIEPHACTVWWPDDSHLEIYDATQMIHNTAFTMAKCFGIKEADVHVNAEFVGGGFGSKMLWNYQMLAVAAARLSKRPVRMNCRRKDVFRLTGGRTCTKQRVALGADADGKLVSLIHTGQAAMTAHNDCPEQFTFPARHLYAAENLLVRQEIVYLDMVANTFMRAPGESIGTFTLETSMDELATALKLDPIELRRRNEPKVDPTSKHEFSHRALLEAYRIGAEKFGWANRKPEPRSTREGEWLIGQGVATALYPYYKMPGGMATIRLTQDGHAIVSAAAHEMGMGTATVQAQAAAERLGLPVERVTFEYGDNKLPKSPIAGGSNQTVAIISAVHAASEKLFESLIKLAGDASPLKGAKLEDIVARDGGLHRKDNSGFETYEAILKRAGQDSLAAEAAAPPPVEMMKFSMFSYGAQFAEVAVNEVTGETRVRRWVGAFDAGRILNPKTATSQFKGGIIMGIGLALTEETLFDERTGRNMNPSFAEYHVPVHADVPDIEILYTDIPDPQAPMGAHGIGEIGITGCGAAIANAIFHATGKRVRSLPMTLDKVL